MSLNSRSVYGDLSLCISSIPRWKLIASKCLAARFVHNPCHYTEHLTQITAECMEVSEGYTDAEMNGLPP